MILIAFCEIGANWLIQHLLTAIWMLDSAMSSITSEKLVQNLLQKCFIVMLTVLGVVNSRLECRAAFNKDVKTVRAQSNQDITFVLPDEADLTSNRNTHHSVPINITNHGMEEVTLLILFDETFPTQDLLSPSVRHKHVELVRNISQDKVAIPANDTVAVQVNFFIPDFVPISRADPYRSKVHISAKRISSNITEIMEPLKRSVKTELSFYLTVTDKRLSDYDDIPPYCESQSCPDIDQCNKTNIDNCDSFEWHADFYINDNITGIKELKTYENSEGISERFSIGTSREVIYHVRSSCCQRGVMITATDLAGNSQNCVAGDYTNVANRNKLNHLQSTWLLFWTIVFCYKRTE